MNHHNQSKPNKSSSMSQLLVFCIICSLGLHLTIIIALTLMQDSEETQLTSQNTQIVKLVDHIPKPKKNRPSEFEIDQQQTKPQPITPVKSFRKADHDQQVDREQAPKGDDARDRTTKKNVAKHNKPQPRSSKPQQKSTHKTNNKPSLKPIKKLTKQIEVNRQPVKSMPTLKELTPDPKVISQIARGDYSDLNSNKDRSGTEIGDTVWLNLQDDRLVSFFRRFHNQIELVWNYPQQAAIEGIEGTLLLLITIDRKGNLIDVDLKQSSGSELLDFEALQAVYRAAPFGPLSKHYPHDKLNIYAHFQYRIAGRIIYGK